MRTVLGQLQLLRSFSQASRINQSQSINMAPNTAPPSIKSQSAPGYDRSFMPKPKVPVGSVIPDVSEFPQNASDKIPALFKPLEIRGVKFNNRMIASPMCMYSSDNGHATDWHLVHIGSMASRGIGGICVEATAVVPEGRISPEDAGIWTSSQVAPLKRIVDFSHAQGVPIGIQLAHAGRKASNLSPWVQVQAQKELEKTGETPSRGASVASDEAGGWQNNVQAPSNIPFADSYAQPQEMTASKIEELKQAFSDAIDRVKQAGFDFIEIHGAHGYLMHNFLSPISNHRDDKYGGSLENRLRLPLEIVELTRSKWDKPLFFRVSASDYFEGEERFDDGVGKDEEWRFWGLQQTTILAQKLKELGVDLIDVSSGGNYVGQKIPLGPGYQAPFAAHIKQNVPGLLVGAVGLITDGKQANDILDQGEADAILLGRELLRNVDFPLECAEQLQVAVQPALQYERAWTRMLKPIEK